MIRWTRISVWWISVSLFLWSWVYEPSGLCRKDVLKLPIDLTTQMTVTVEYPTHRE